MHMIIAVIPKDDGYLFYFVVAMAMGRMTLYSS